MKASLGSSLASWAPRAEPAAASTTSGSTVRQSGRTRRAYVIELVAVPHIDETLFVPRIAAGGVPAGSPMSSAGSDQPAPADDGVDPARDERREHEQGQGPGRQVDAEQARQGGQGPAPPGRRAGVLREGAVKITGSA